jgi:hypothetical protein
MQAVEPLMAFESQLKIKLVLMHFAKTHALKPQRLAECRNWQYSQQ